MSLPKDLYPLVKDVPIPAKWLFGDDINARINNIKAQQNTFKVDKTPLCQAGYLIGQPIFLNKIKKTWRDFPNPRKSIHRLQRQSWKTDIQESKELAEKVSISKHNECSLIVPANVLYSDVGNIEGGKSKYYYKHWKKYTSDTFILDIIKNELKLDFNEIPFQHCCNIFPLLKEEMSIINSEIK